MRNRGRVEKPQPGKPGERPSKRDERKHVIAAIIQENGGKLAKKTILFKAYYLAHLFYWGNERGLLTREHDIVRMPNGPGIRNHVELLDEMKRDGLITVGTQKCGPFDEAVYTTQKRVEVDDATRKAVKSALKFVGGMTAKKASEFSHDISRTWQAGKNGEHLDIYLDVMDDDEFASHSKLVDDVAARIDGIFK